MARGISLMSQLDTTVLLICPFPHTSAPPQDFSYPHLYLSPSTNFTCKEVNITYPLKNESDKYFKKIKIMLIYQMEQPYYLLRDSIQL
jgi:hypothetical protein